MTVRELCNGIIHTGKLRTDTAASSYGQPVLVLEDGLELGPGDLVGEFAVLEIASAEEQAWLSPVQATLPFDDMEVVRG